jgi:Holliday junction resolvase-like predicted endonuclease
MSKDSMKTRGLDAAGAYITRIGMEIMDRDYSTAQGSIAFVAMDEGILVHIAVFINTDGEPAERTVKKYRARMRDYMTSHHLVREVRYDTINIKVLAPDRALLRHYRGTIGGN